MLKPPPCRWWTRARAVHRSADAGSCDKPLQVRSAAGATRAVAATFLVCLALSGCATRATANPDASGDAVAEMLRQRGLLDADGQASDPPQGLAARLRDRSSDMVISAMNFLGVPYRRGGSSEETGFDCSGFTRHVFEKSLGLVLPRRVDDQANAAGFVAVSRDELRPGDLVFFNTLKRTFSHVGIYVGDGKFIHAPRTGSAVRVEDMRYAYWSQRFTGARRAGPSLEPTAHATSGDASDR